MALGTTMLIAALVYLLPGAVTNLVAGLRLPWAVAAALPVSFFIYGFAGWTLSQLGVGFGVLSVLGFWAVVLLVAGLWRLLFWLPRRSAQRERVGGVMDPVWILPLAGVATGCFLFLRRVLANFEGFRQGLDTIFQGWDVHWHASEVRFIVETGMADPTRMGELRNLETHGEMFYPSAWHAGTALVSELASITPIEATNLSGFFIPAIALPITAALFAWTMLRSRGATAQIAAGLAAVAIVASPVVYWIGFFVGAWPYVAAISMTGMVIGLFMSVPSAPSRALPAALAFMGMVMVHPSATTIVVMVLALWWFTWLLFVPAKPGAGGFVSGLLVRLQDFGLLATTGIVAVLLLLPQLLAGTGESEDVKSYTAEEDVTRAESWWNILTMKTRHSDFFGELDWTWLVVLTGVGLVIALVWRRNAWPALFTALSTWIAANSLRPFAEPWGGWLDLVGSLHYSTAHRLVMPVSIMMFAAAAVAVAVAIRMVCFGWLKGSTASLVSVLISAIVALMAGAVLVPWVNNRIAEGADKAIGMLYNDERMVSDKDRAAFDWLAKQPKAYEGLIAGEPADGYGWMYAYNGLPSLGRHYQFPAVPEGSATLRSFTHPGEIGTGKDGNLDMRNDSDDAVDALNINYYFVSPDNFWHFQKPNRSLVEDAFFAPGLTLIYRDFNISILAVNAHFSDEELEKMRASGSPEKLPAQLTYRELGIEPDASAKRRAGSGDPADEPYFHRSTIPNPKSTLDLSDEQKDRIRQVIATSGH